MLHGDAFRFWGNSSLSGHSCAAFLLLSSSQKRCSPHLSLLRSWITHIDGNESLSRYISYYPFIPFCLLFFLFNFSPLFFSLIAYWKFIDTWLHSFSCRRTQHEWVSQRKWEVVGPSFEVVCCFSQHTRGSYVGSFPVLQSYVSVSLCHNVGDATCVIFWLKWVGDKPQPLQVCPLAFAECCCVHESIRFCMKIVWRCCLRILYRNKTTTGPRVLSATGDKS